MEQEYISRNPARKLILPDTRAEDSRALMIPEVVKLVGRIQGRDLLIVRLFVECGLRPGELFAIRRDDYTAGQLRIDEKVWGEIFYNEVKTETSEGFVWVPVSLRAELEW